MDAPASICSVCHQPVQAEHYFCANCGHSLKEKPVPITPAAQLGVYALSIFLPPLGLWPGIKYLSKENPHAKRVGWIAIGLTIFSSAASIWAMFSLYEIYLSQLNAILN